MISRRIAAIAAFTGLAVSVLVWLGALILPMYSSSSSTGQNRRATVVEVNGARVLVVLAIPVVITLFGWLASVARLPHVVLPIACALMWIWTLLTGFSVGLLYLPVDAALIVAVAASPNRPQRLEHENVA